MSKVYKTTQLSIMDFSKIFTEGEYIKGTIFEIGLPPLIYTNKAIYKCMSGVGNIENTGEKYDTYNQMTKEFDFSDEHPIFQNTWKIVAFQPKKELKILTYQMMVKLNSILYMKNYFFEHWITIRNQVNRNIKAYEYSSTLLPQIPMLKETLDGFFVEGKDLISYILTLFKLYYLNKDIKDTNPNESNCLEEIKKETFFSQNKKVLIIIFQQLNEIALTLRTIRNAISHPENYKDNYFCLYNVHWENNKNLASPIIEYKAKYCQGQISVLEYVDTTYNSLLKICGSFLNILIQDVDVPN